MTSAEPRTHRDATTAAGSAYSCAGRSWPLVLNLLVIIAGIAAYQCIEIRELPDVDRPVVTVRSS